MDTHKFHIDTHNHKESIVIDSSICTNCCSVPTEFNATAEGVELSDSMFNFDLLFAHTEMNGSGSFAST